MSEINIIEERLDDLPGPEMPSRSTASRASGWPQFSGGKMDGKLAERGAVRKQAENARV